MKSSLRLLLAGLILGLTFSACARTAAPAVRLPDDSLRVLTHDGRARDYYLHIPASLDRTRPAPLVMVFHGGGGKAQNAIRTTGFNALADEKGFIVAYPNGTGPLDVQVFTWNGGTCCGNAMLENADDVGFARAILADIQTVAAVDAKRVYAAGMSNGGILAYRLACEAADVFAAVGSVAGTLNFAPCLPSEAVSVIHFHGTEDTQILYEGGYVPESILQVDFASVADSVGFWAAFNGCASQPETSQQGEVRREVWQGCKAGASVELVTILGGGHTWPGSDSPGLVGGDEPTHAVSATDIIWEFFAAHPKP